MTKTRFYAIANREVVPVPAEAVSLDHAAYWASVSNTLTAEYNADPAAYAEFLASLREIKPGDVFEYPVSFLFPRGHKKEKNTEWDSARAGESHTEGPIEVYLTNGDWMTVRDGHNRLKTAISQGQTVMTCCFHSHRD